MRNSRKYQSGLLFLFIAMSGICLTSGVADAAWYAKFDGVDGSVTDEGYQGQIKLESFSWDVTNQGPISPGGTRMTHRDFHFVKFVDKASPVLMKLSCAGDQIPQATMTLTRTTGDQSEPYMVVTLKDCIITNYSIGGSSSGESFPLEEVSISFSEVRYDFYFQTETGQYSNVSAECTSQPLTK